MLYIFASYKIISFFQFNKYILINFIKIFICFLGLSQIIYKIIMKNYFFDQKIFNNKQIKNYFIYITLYYTYIF